MKKLSPFFKQWYASVGPSLLFFGLCYTVGLYAVMISSLRQPASTIQLTLEEETWIQSIFYLMLFPSQLISGLLTNKYGRKRIICLSALPNIVAGFLAYTAADFNALFAASFIGGMGGGAISLGLVFIAELTSPKHRGIMINFRELFIYVGQFTAHFFGIFFGWRILILFTIVPTILGLAITLSCPESPAWLASKGRFENCKKAFHWYRGKEEQEELNQLIECQSKVLLKKEEASESKSKVMNVKTYLFDKGFWKANVISFMILLFYSFSGKMYFQSYSIDIMTSITGDKNTAYYYATTLDLFDFISFCSSFIYIRYFARKDLLIKSSFSSISSLLLFCLSNFLSAKEIISKRYSWITFTFIALHFIIFILSSMPILFILLGEIYPLAYRGLGTIVTSLIFTVFSFLITKLLPFVVKSLGLHGAFLICAVGLAVSSVTLHYLIPETHNKTLQDIENEIKGEIICDFDKYVNNDASEKMLA